jgi:outer membrane protein assembly factor BamB
VSPEGILYALNAGGQLKWNLTIPNTGEGIDSLTSPTIGPDGTIYVSDVDFRVLAVNPNGTLKWEVATAGEVVGSPAVAPDGTVFVEVDDPGPPVGVCQVLNKCILALNSDGSVKWALQNFGEFDSPAIGPDGTVYVSGEAVSSNGTLEWESRPFSSPSIGADGTIYGTAEGGLYAVNRDGSVRWQFPTVRDSGSSNPCCSYVSVQQSSVAIGSGGIEYFGVGVTHFCSCGPSPSGYGNASLYAVSPNGALVWKFAITSVAACASLACASASISDPAIGPYGTIYVGSGDGNLYAID